MGGKNLQPNKVKMETKIKLREDARYVYYMQKLPDGRIVSFKEPKWSWVMSKNFPLDIIRDRLDDISEDIRRLQEREQ